jgi:hypothetical protein
MRKLDLGTTKVSELEVGRGIADLPSEQAMGTESGTIPGMQEAPPSARGAERGNSLDRSGPARS